MKKLFSIFILSSVFCLLSSYFASAQSLDSVEYFFDVDPGVGNGFIYAPASGDSITDSISIKITGLSEGFHTLFFRVRDTNGIWSLYEGSRFFAYDTTVIVSAPFDSSSGEYFFDTNPSVNNGWVVTSSPGDSITDTILVSTTGLVQGFHNFFYRAKDSNNVWSFYEGLRFYLYDTLAPSVSSSYPIVSAEYFYDLDTGIGTGISLSIFPPADSVLFSDTLPTTPLTAGTHHLFLRVRDSMNTWSLYEGQSFVICNLIPKPDFSSDTACLNFPTALSDLSANVDTNFNYTYSWDFNNDGKTDDTTKGNTTYTFPTSGTHTVSLIVNNTNGCADTIVKTVYVNSLPGIILNFSIDTICKGDTLLLSGGYPTGGTYSGKGVYGGTFYSDSVNSGNHTITYTYSNSDSCSATASDKIYVSLCTGIHEAFPIDIGIEFQVNPNPFRESAALKIEGNKGLSEIRVNLFNVFGQEVYQSSITGNYLSIPRGNLTAGVYFLKISAEGKMLATGKFIVID